MTDLNYKKVGHLLKNEQKMLHLLFAKIESLSHLDKLVKTYLDPQLHPYCQVANVDQARLTLLTANASIATQIRFLSYDLLERFKKQPTLKNIKEIKCKIYLAPNLSNKSQPSNNYLQPISTHTAAIIQEIANTISDPTLKEIMMRIAAKGK